MVNPAICRKCPHCRGVDLPIREGDVLVAEVMVHCGPGEDLTVAAPVPENCPYRLEHLLLEENTERLKEGWDDERTGQ